MALKIFDAPSRMKHFLLLSLVCSAILQANAQLGITASSTHNYALDWQVVTENYIVHRRAEFLRYGTSGTLDYAFNLKEGVVKFRPALAFSLSNAVFKKHYFQLSTIGIEGNIEVALTSHKTKSGKKRALRPYLQLSPGLALINYRHERPKDDINESTEVSKSNELAPNFGANLLIEFKLSPLLTISPMCGGRIYPNLEWEHFTENVTKGTMSNTYDETNWRQFLLGLRFGLNFK